MSQGMAASADANGNCQRYDASIAPLLTPSRYGSASGLRRIAWYTTPEAASAAPTSDATSTISTRRLSTYESLGQPTDPVEPTSRHAPASSAQTSRPPPSIESILPVLHRSTLLTTGRST